MSLDQTVRALSAEEISRLSAADRQAAELARGKPVEAATEAVQAAPAVQATTLAEAPEKPPVAATPYRETAFKPQPGLTTEVELKWPLVVGDEPVTSVTVRMPSIGTIKRVYKPGVGDRDPDLLVVQVLTGLPYEVVESLSLPDFNRVLELAQGFLPGVLAAEQTSPTGEATAQ